MMPPVALFLRPLRPLTVSILLICAPMLAGAQTGPPRINEPRDAALAFVAAVAAQDAHAVAQLYLSDAVLLAPGAPPTYGRDAIRALWAQNFAPGANAIAFRDISGRRGVDRAAIIWTWALRIGPQGRVQTGRSLIFMDLTPAGWRITADLWQPAP